MTFSVFLDLCPHYLPWQDLLLNRELADSGSLASQLIGTRDTLFLPLECWFTGGPPHKATLTGVLGVSTLNLHTCQVFHQLSRLSTSLQLF